MIHADITEAVGSTPMVALRRLPEKGSARVLCKLEARNPCGSVKDRVGVALVKDAEAKGLIKPDTTLVEPTSGNTGIALAFTAAARGLRLVLTMPERISSERVALLRFLGAEVVLTPGALMQNAVERAQRLVDETPGAVMLQQFDNPANPEIHRQTTAVEILEATDGEVDALVVGVGTGGTITGVGEVLKKHNPKVKIIAVEPAGAAVLSGRKASQHYLPGLGAGFVPSVLNRDIIDQVIAVADETAFKMQLALARQEGINAGISSGAAAAAALDVAKRPEFAGKTVVTILPDSGERYVTSATYRQLASDFGLLES